MANLKSFIKKKIYRETITSYQVAKKHSMVSQLVLIPTSQLKSSKGSQGVYADGYDIPM